MSVPVKSVLLIGLGNVAVGYDTADASSMKVLSHARSFSRHSAFRLVGGVDPDVSCRNRFEAVYVVPSYSDIASAMNELLPDVVVVATPTFLHLQAVTEVFAAGQPLAMLCEKPLAYELDQAREIVNRCALNNCSLYVNYVRQSEPGVAEVRERIRNGKIETPIKGVAWYSKGLFNSGAHFLNLLQNLLGEVSDVRVISAGRQWRENDPEPDVIVDFSTGQVLFIAVREEHYFYNALELVAPNGRLRYDSGGVQIIWQGVEADTRFSGYRRLSDEYELIATDFDRIQWHPVNQLAESLEGRTAQLCSGLDALRTQEVLAMIKEKM